MSAASSLTTISGRFFGTLPISQLGLKASLNATPSIVVSFRSYTTGCDEPTIARSKSPTPVLRQGQGMHGRFGARRHPEFHGGDRPDFKGGYVDALPVSNADVGATAARLLGLTQKSKGRLIGRGNDGGDA